MAIWEAYSSSDPCAMSLAIGIVRVPLLSSSPLQAWGAYGATVRDSTNDMCVVTFSDGIDSLFYTVDTVRWVPTGLRIVGDTAYEAVYRWGEFQGIPVLDTVALKGDLTMGSGGIVFDSIRVNGTLGGQTEVRAAGMVGSLHHGRSAAAISLGHGVRSGTRGSVVFDLGGRLVPWRRTRPDGVAPGAAGGVYLIAPAHDNRGR